MRDIFITAGDSRTLVLRVKNQNYNVVDITGAKIMFTVKKNFYDADSLAVIQKTTDDDITITDAANGVAQIRLTPADTDPATNTDLDLTTYVYDIQVQLHGNTFTLITGNLTITRHITHGSL